MECEHAKTRRFLTRFSTKNLRPLRGTDCADRIETGPGDIKPYLISLIIYRKPPPLLNGRLDWTTIAEACGIEACSATVGPLTATEVSGFECPMRLQNSYLRERLPKDRMNHDGRFAAKPR
ncbi:hypothetical protein ATY76_08795 [Rhizobium sp. R339]|nr:hypothetical protein ATY76_08795 [Rhizobium sp. R339]